MPVKPLSNPFIALLVSGHIYCVSDETGVQCRYRTQTLINSVILWTVVLSLSHATIYLFHIIAFDPKLYVVPSDISSSACCLSCWLAPAKWLSMLQLGSAGLVLLDITLQSLWLRSEVIRLAAKNCLAFLPCVINKLAACKVHCVCCSEMKNLRKSL